MSMTTYGEGMKALSAVQQPAVLQTELDMQNKLLAENAELLEQLSMRLNPIMRSEPNKSPHPQPDGTPNGNSAIVITLHAANLMIEQANQKMRTWLNLLEI